MSECVVFVAGEGYIVDGENVMLGVGTYGSLDFGDLEAGVTRFKVVHGM